MALTPERVLEVGEYYAKLDRILHIRELLSLLDSDQERLHGHSDALRMWNTYSQRLKPIKECKAIISDLEKMGGSLALIA
jgi:hypothetical protein